MKYIYNGPLTSVNLKDQEYVLFPEKEIDLPENSSWVKTQVAMKRLIPVKKKNVRKTKSGGKK